MAKSNFTVRVGEELKQGLLTPLTGTAGELGRNRLARELVQEYRARWVAEFY